jgi:hypothetical protein
MNSGRKLDIDVAASVHPWKSVDGTGAYISIFEGGRQEIKALENRIILFGGLWYAPRMIRLRLTGMFKEGNIGNI